MIVKAIQTDPTAAKNFLTYSVTFGTSPKEINRRLETGERLMIIDVREKPDFDKGHLPSARHLPEAQWNSPSVGRRDEINFLYGYSETCRRVAKATTEFMAHGFPVIKIQGGFEAWQKDKLPIEE